MKSKFWLAWNPVNGAPHKRHESKIDAEVEAQRLARCNRDCEIYVLEVTDSFYLPSQQKPVHNKFE